MINFLLIFDIIGNLEAIFNVLQFAKQVNKTKKY